MNIRDVPRHISLVNNEISSLKKLLNDDKDKLKQIETKLKYEISIETTNGKKSHPNAQARDLELQNKKSESKFIQELEDSIKRNTLRLDYKLNEKEYYNNILMVHFINKDVVIERFDEFLKSGL